MLYSSRARRQGDQPRGTPLVPSSLGGPSQQTHQDRSCVKLKQPFGKFGGIKDLSDPAAETALGGSPLRGVGSSREAEISYHEFEPARRVLHAQARSLVHTYAALSSRVAAQRALGVPTSSITEERLMDDLATTIDGVAASLNSTEDEAVAPLPLLPALPEGISLLPAPNVATKGSRDAGAGWPRASASAMAAASCGIEATAPSAAAECAARVLWPPQTPRERTPKQAIKWQLHEVSVRRAAFLERTVGGIRGQEEEVPIGVVSETATLDFVAEASSAAEAASARLAFAAWPPEELRWRAHTSLHQLSKQLRFIWHCFLKEVLPRVDSLVGALSDSFLRGRYERFGKSLFRESRPFEHRAYMPRGEGGIAPLVISQSLRSSAYFMGLPKPLVHDISLRPEEQPVLIEQRYSPTGDVHEPLLFRSGKVLHAVPGIERVEDGETDADDCSSSNGATRCAGVDLLEKTMHEQMTYGDKNKRKSIGTSSKPQLRLSWMRETRLKWGEATHPQPYANGGAPGSGGALGIHLFVFVHGFHGNSFDLRGMRNQLALMLPNKASARFLLSAVNEQHTAICSFAQLGDNLAGEIAAFIDAEGISSGLCRVSFFCHSFGAIICRAALRTEALKPLLLKLHTYVSFSGPHLGMLYSSNLLVELGVWGLRRWRNAHCLTELSLKDEAEPHRCYLFELSRDDKLRHFRNLLLVSSAEDRYVPHHSARIQLCPEAIHDAKYGSIFVGMVHNLLAPLECEHILHIDTIFSAPAATRMSAQLDAAIGRFAHIAFLEQQAFIQMFVQMYLPYLC